MKSYISQDSQVLGGAAVITGTRIPISRIIFLMSEGYTPDLIQQQYPFVSLGKIKGAVTELITTLDRHVSKEI